MLPFPGVKLRVGRGNGPRRDPQHGVEGIHRVEPTVEAEHEFIEVRLEMVRLDTTMMGTVDPCFQIAKNEMDHWEVRLCLLRVAIERQRLMVVSKARQLPVTHPSVSADRGAGGDILRNKGGERVGVAAGERGWLSGDHAETETAGVDAALMALVVSLARADFHGANHGGLVMDAASLPFRLAAHVGLVNLDGVAAANHIPLGTHHARTELVEDLERGLVAGKAKLPLELDSTLSGGLGGHEVGAPKPRRKGCMARLDDGSGCQGRVDLAGSATEHRRGAGGESIGFTDDSALRASEAIRPAHSFQVAGACAVVRKDALKLWQRSREFHERDDNADRPFCQASV